MNNKEKFIHLFEKINKIKLNEASVDASGNIENFDPNYRYSFNGEYLYLSNRITISKIYDNKDKKYKYLVSDIFHPHDYENDEDQDDLDELNDNINYALKYSSFLEDNEIIELINLFKN
ncbi:MAG: hypothetical protein ACOC33_00280 [bacterium]